MNSLLCIGCDDYSDANLLRLSGAEQDANGVFQVLAKDEELYSPDRSILLRSPTTIELTEGLTRCLGTADSVDVFTFFFAGHGGQKAGTFYLCTKDSRLSSLSTTAFPLSKFFEIINELSPRHVNIIVDACESGSSVSNTPTLLRTDDFGTIAGTSISFLGACAGKQSAAETADGGVLTNELLKILRGEIDLQIQGPFIDLSEVASFVSDEIVRHLPEQRPTRWGLNLFGRAWFARNPRFNFADPLPPFSMASVDPRSAMGQRLSLFSRRLWEEYRQVNDDFDASRLNHLLSDLLNHESLTVEDRVVAVAGLSSTISRHASMPDEMLSESLASITFSVSLLPWAEQPSVREFANQQLAKEFENNLSVFVSLTSDIKAKPNILLSHNGLVSDLYYLPLRITKLLGWAGSFAILGEILGYSSETSRKIHREFVETLVSTYPLSIVALSDEQASGLYIFIKAALKFGWTETAVEVIQCMYLDACLKKGRVNRLGADGEGALEHVLQLIESPLASEARTPANPSFLLPVILLGGVWLKCADDWELEALDRRSVAFYIPDDYRDFAQESIQNGKSYTYQIGFGVWLPEELEANFQMAMTADLETLSPELHALAVLASVLYPNRISFNLEAI